VKVAVNLDSSSPESSQLKREYNADYPPMHVIITPDGEELVKISGYADKDSFIQYLETAKQRANSGETQ
jgi:thioredoxin-related protein